MYSHHAFQLFSEGKSPVQVAIALNLEAGRVRAIYYDYWERLFDLIRLYKIFKDLGMGEQDIRKVFELVKHNELQNLQWKVEYLRNEIGILEIQTELTFKKASVSTSIESNERMADFISPNGFASTSRS